MKKILSVLLFFSLLLSLCSCEGILFDPPAAGKETDKDRESQDETYDIIYPDTFAVGYSTIDISGSPDQFPLAYYGGIATGVHDPLMLSCTALWDGEQAALIMTADLKKMYDTVANASFTMIENKFGIPSENVIISCTHTHAAPDAGEFKEGASQWLQQYYDKLLQVVEEALWDLAPLSGVYIGKNNMEEGVTFVRRYLLADGTYKMNPSFDDNPIAHETKADPEMRTIRFEREGKKDVLLVNFQTHYGGADELYPEHLSADFIDPFRTQIQKELNCHFAYYSGAGGDINMVSMIRGEQKYSGYLTSTGAFVDAAKGTIAKEEEVSCGKILAERNLYMGTAKQFSAELLEKTRQVVSLGGDDTPEGRALMKKYGFADMDEIDYIQLYQNQDPQLEVNLNAISFGDIAFVGIPYEMFHENGSFVRENSPFKMTFLCTLSGDANGYVPSALGFKNGSYETFNCRFVAGSGEEFAAEILRLLNACNLLSSLERRK